jgi:hypothetical protein
MRVVYLFPSFEIEKKNRENKGMKNELIILHPGQVLTSTLGILCIRSDGLLEIPTF